MDNIIVGVMILIVAFVTYKALFSKKSIGNSPKGGTSDSSNKPSDDNKF